MSRMGLLALMLAGQVLIASPSPAQEAAPDNDNGRFSLFRTEGGYLRLDARTGELSNCVQRQSRWQCQAVPEERIAFESEIARLQADNAALKKELLAHQVPLPQGMRPEPVRDRSDREIGRVRTVIKSMWRRVVAFVAGVQRDLLKRS
jgi:hypothetical protein